MYAWFYISKIALLLLLSGVELQGAASSISGKHPVAQMLQRWGTEIVPDLIENSKQLREYAASAAKIQQARYEQLSGGLSDEEALQRAIKESLKPQQDKPFSPSVPVSHGPVPWAVTSVPEALREIGMRVRPEQALVSTDDVREFANLIHLNNVTEYQEWQFRDFQMIPVGNRLPARLPVFTVPFVRSLQQREADCGFYAAYNAILFARQMPVDMFNDTDQYSKVEMEVRQHIAQANRAKLPELQARLARARTRRDRDDIQREIRRRQEVAERRSNITSDDVGIVLSDLEPSIAICGEDPRVLVDTFNQNRTNPDFIARYAEVYAADQLTRNLMLRIAEFQVGGPGARLVIVPSSARLGAIGHWIAVEIVKNDVGQMVARAADSAGQHQELAKNTVALACEPMIRDIAEAIRTFYPEEPAPLLLPDELQQDSLIGEEFQYPFIKEAPGMPSSSTLPFPPAPLKPAPAPPSQELVKTTQPKPAPKSKPFLKPSLLLPSSSTDVSSGPDLQTWWRQEASGHAAFVLPFYRNSSGQRIFIFGREALGTDRGMWSPFGGKCNASTISSKPKIQIPLEEPAACAWREFAEESGLSKTITQRYVTNSQDVFAVNSMQDIKRTRNLLVFYIVELLTESEVAALYNSFKTKRDKEMDALAEVTEKDLEALKDMKSDKNGFLVKTTEGKAIQLRGIFFRVKNYLRNPSAGIPGRGGVRFQDNHLKK